MAARRICCFFVISLLFGGKLSLGLLDDALSSDVNVVKLRLSEEKSKRLLIQNDVESLMLKMEEMQRTINGKSKLFSNRSFSFDSKI